MKVKGKGLTKSARAGRSSPAYRFDHLLLWVKDEEAAKDFYVGKLGFELLNDDNEAGLYTVGVRGGFSISFHRMGVDREGTGLEVDSAGTKNVHLDFQVPDVDAAYASLVRRGVKFLRPPRDMPWGERHTWLCDPDGYIVGLSSEIGRKGR